MLEGRVRIYHHQSFLQVDLGSCDYACASLSLSTTLHQTPVLANESYCAIYNPDYTSIPTQSRPDASQFHEAFFLNVSTSSNPFGCEDLPPGFQKNLSLIVERGNCTFYRKALVAQTGKASMLVVIYNATVVTSVPSLEPEGNSSGPSISIPVLFVGNHAEESMKVGMHYALLLESRVPSLVALFLFMHKNGVRL